MTKRCTPGLWGQDLNLDTVYFNALRKPSHTLMLSFPSGCKCSHSNQSRSTQV